MIGPVEWTKSPPELAELFQSVVPDNSLIERRKMFGYPCAIVNGNMFAGLHQSNMVLRLSEEHLRQFLAIPGAGTFEPMPGRPMKGFAVVPQPMLKQGQGLEEWIDKAFEDALAMPAKTPKPKKAAAKAKK
jgi:TfoX/Sxy family transcriptional regulator of competence genes